MITSANNTQVKNIIQLNQKAKARREQGLFVAEGRKMFGEAPKDWISRVYVTESLTATRIQPASSFSAGFRFTFTESPCFTATRFI